MVGSFLKQVGFHLSCNKTEKHVIGNNGYITCMLFDCCVVQSLHKKSTKTIILLQDRSDPACIGNPMSSFHDSIVAAVRQMTRKLTKEFIINVLTAARSQMEMVLASPPTISVRPSCSSFTERM